MCSGINLKTLSYLNCHLYTSALYEWRRNLVRKDTSLIRWGHKQAMIQSTKLSLICYPSKNGLPIFCKLFNCCIIYLVFIFRHFLYYTGNGQRSLSQKYVGFTLNTFYDGAQTRTEHGLLRKQFPCFYKDIAVTFLLPGEAFGPVYYSDTGSKITLGDDIKKKE